MVCGPDRRSAWPRAAVRALLFAIKTTHEFATVSTASPEPAVGCVLSLGSPPIDSAVGHSADSDICDGRASAHRPVGGRRSRVIRSRVASCCAPSEPGAWSKPTMSTVSRSMSSYSRSHQDTFAGRSPSREGSASRRRRPSAPWRSPDRKPFSTRKRGSPGSGRSAVASLMSDPAIRDHRGHRGSSEVLGQACCNRIDGDAEDVRRPHSDIECVPSRSAIRRAPGRRRRRFGLVNGQVLHQCLDKDPCLDRQRSPAGVERVHVDPFGLEFR